MVFFGRLATLTAVIVLALITDVGAQVQSPIPIQRLSAPIEFDGLSYEPAWEEIQSFPMVGHEPVFGEQPSERTEVRVAYDDDYMYFALRAYDSDPDAIRANILYRDRFGSDDYFEVMLDTFNDNETALIFTTNPAGKRRDVEVSRDASGPISTWLNADFDTFWDSAVTITEEGWFAEIRVPFSSMRFQDVDGRVVMGMSLQRIIARKSERVTFPSIEPNVEWSYLKPSRKQKIVMDGVYSRNAVYIRPYGVGGLERTSRFSNLDARHYYERDRLGDAGIDLKYGLTII